MNSWTSWQITDCHKVFRRPVVYLFWLICQLFQSSEILCDPASKWGTSCCLTPVCVFYLVKRSATAWLVVWLCIYIIGRYWYDPWWHHLVSILCGFSVLGYPPWPPPQRASTEWGQSVPVLLTASMILTSRGCLCTTVSVRTATTKSVSRSIDDGSILWCLITV